MSSLVQRNKAVAKRKGAVAAATGVGAGVALVVVNPILGVIGLAGAAYLGYDWLQFRIRNGLRF